MSPNGVCGIEFWIADELWRMAHASPRDYHRFVRTVALMVTIGEKKPRMPLPHHPLATAHDDEKKKTLRASVPHTIGERLDLRADGGKGSER